MLKYKIVSDGPHRRKRTSSFPEQMISQFQAKDLAKTTELNPTNLPALTDETAINWFDLAQGQSIKPNEESN